MTTRALGLLGSCFLLLAGCGGGSSHADSSETSGGEVCTARTDADALTDALEACRAAQEAEPPWVAQASYEALFEQLRTHLSSVSDPREVTTEEVQPIADAIWAFLDELSFTGAAESLRTQAENAAEGLLRDRGRDQSGPAAQAAYEAVTSVRATLHPPGIDPCAELATSAEDARARAAQICNQ
jgi:hypothetical protein